MEIIARRCIKLLLCEAVIIATAFVGIAAEAKHDAMQQDVVKKEFARYLAGEISKSEFADFCHQCGRDLKWDAAIRYQVLSGAFRCYMEAGDVAHARDVVVTLMDQKLPQHDIVDLLRESNVYFGVNCFDFSCPHILESIYRAGSFFRPTDVSVRSLDDLSFGKLPMSLAVHSNKMDKVSAVTRVRDKEAGIGLYKCLRIAIDKSMVKSVRLYLTPKSAEVFQMEFLYSAPSYVQTKRFEDDVDSIIEELSRRFDVDISIIRLSGVGADDLHEEYGHNDKNKKITFGDCHLHDQFERQVADIRDYGVGALQINGSVYEDMHHCRYARIKIADRERLALAVREVHGLQQSFPVASRHASAVYLKDNNSRREMLCRKLGEEGGKVERSDPDVAARWYKLAADAGNPMARKWLIAHPEASMARKSRKSVYGLEFSKVLVGSRTDADGWGPCVDWISSGDGHLKARDDYWGVKFGIAAADFVGECNGIQCSGLWNEGKDCPAINGVLVAALANVCLNGRVNGVMVGCANLECDSVCNGISVSAVSDANIGGVINGMQVAPWGCMCQSMNGFSLAAYVNVCGDVSGVQGSGVVNVALDRLPIPDWLAKHMPVGNSLSVGGGTVSGMQLSGLLNYVGGEMCGVQIGAVNYARRLSGVQIGVWNIVAEGGIFMMPFLNMNF